MNADHLRPGALVLICGGVVVNFGLYDDLGMALLVIGAGLALIAQRHAPGALGGPRAWTLLVGALGLEGVYAAGAFGSGVSTIAAAVVAVTVICAVLAPARQLASAALVAGGAAFGVMLVPGWQWGVGNIDVFDIVVRAGRELAHGVNPYGNHSLLTFQEIAGRYVLVHFAFPYGPAVLLLTLPFALLGDVRPVTLGAGVGMLTAVFALAWRNRSSARPDLRVVAAACLAFPLTAKMIDWTWVDIYLMALVCAWLALRTRHRRTAVALLGLALAIKPLMVAPLILPLFAWSARARRESLAAAGVAAALVVPFVVATGPAAFYDAVAGFFARLPPRSMSLTFDAVLLTGGYSAMPFAVGLAVVALAAVYLVRARPRDLADALAAGAALSTVAFLFAKQAFFNYYFDGAVFLLLSVVTRGLPVDEASEEGDLSHAPRVEAMLARAS